MASDPEDVIYNRVRIHLDWRDRVRVLLRGRIDVDVDNECEHRPGHVVSQTRVTVPKLRPRPAGPPMEATRDA